MGEKIILQVLYALISGFCEFLPVSASAHEQVFRYIFGLPETAKPVTICIHLGALIAVIICSHRQFARFSRERRMARYSRRGRRNRQSNIAVLMDSRIFATAAVPVIFGAVAAVWMRGRIRHCLVLSLLILINGVVLFMPRLLKRGNKDGRTLSRLDAFLIGTGAAAGVVPGFSGIGCAMAVGQARGTSKEYALEMAILLSVPALGGAAIADLLLMAIGGMAINGVGLLLGLLSGVMAFGGGFLAIVLVRYIVTKTELTAFAYYNWGLSLFLFILYLIV